MKKANSIFLFAALFFFSCSSISAQSWLKKVSKAIDNAGKQIDKQVQNLNENLNEGEATTTTEASTETATPVTPPVINIADYSLTKIKTFKAQVKIVVESCIRENNTVTIKYIMKNEGPQLSLVSIGTKKSILNPNDDTAIYDDLGNAYKLAFHSLGKERTYSEGQTMPAIMPSNVPMKGVMEIKSVDPAAKSFSLVNIVLLIRNSADKLEPYSYSFADLPIYNIEDVIR